ncbi:hypothetical protein OC861_004586 [Tilletia horrida]|nr:hypothetical protein OC861_004586 [Tilletia horrida]
MYAHHAYTTEQEQPTGPHCMLCFDPAVSQLPPSTIPTKIHSRPKRSLPGYRFAQDRYPARSKAVLAQPSAEASAFVSAWTAASLDGYPAHSPSQLPNSYTSVPLPPPVKLPAPGTPPFDGFIVGVPDHPTNLAILPAQPSKAPLSNSSLSSSSSPFSTTHRGGGSGNAIAMHALINDQPTTSRSGIAAATHALPLDPAATGAVSEPKEWNTIRTDVTLAKVLSLLESHQLLAQSRAEAEAKATAAQVLLAEQESQLARQRQPAAVTLSATGMPPSSSNSSKGKGKQSTRSMSEVPSSSRYRRRPSTSPGRSSLPPSPAGMVGSNSSARTRRHSSSSPSSPSSTSDDCEVSPVEAGSSSSGETPGASSGPPREQHTSGSSYTSQPMTTSTSLPGYASHVADINLSPAVTSRPNLIKHPSSTRQPTHVRLSHDRVAIARSALPLLGQSEEGRESGAAGGIRAVSRYNDSATPSGSEMDSDDGGASGSRIVNRARRIHHIRRRLGLRERSDHASGSGRNGDSDLRRRNTHDMLTSDADEDELSYSGGSGLQDKRDSMRARFGYRSQISDSPDIGGAWATDADARFDDSRFERDHSTATPDVTEAVEDHHMDGASMPASPSGVAPMNLSSPKMTGAIPTVGQNLHTTGTNQSEVASKPNCPPSAPSSESKQSSDTQGARTSEQQEISDLQTALLDVLECQLCYLLLYEPLTTPCGHTFCRACFARNLDHSDRCPLCRSRMPSWGFWQDHPTNQGLLNVITLQIDQSTPTGSHDSNHNQPAVSGHRFDELDGHQDESAEGTLQRKMDAVRDEGHKKWLLRSPSSQTIKEFGAVSTASVKAAGRVTTHGIHNVTWELPSLYLERRLAAEADEAKARLSTPIFVCTLAYPDMPTVLHIYEPRYRLMIRRCLESGNPRFGMVMPARTSSPNAPGMYEYGTMLEIRSVQMLPDGRSMLETVGSYRFRVFETGTLDGYTVGRVERIEDVGPEEDMEMERTFVELANRAARAAGAVDPISRSASASHDQSAERSHVPATDQAGYVLGLDVGVADAFLRASENTHSAGTGNVAASGAASAGVGNADTNGPSTPSPASVLAGSAMARTESSSAASIGNSSASTFGDSLPPMLAAAHPTTDELVDVCTSFIEVLRSGSAPLLLTRLNQSYGPMPSREEIGRLAYWMALVM